MRVTGTELGCDYGLGGGIQIRVLGIRVWVRVNN